MSKQIDRHPTTRFTKRSFLAVLCFFFSGFAALIYEICCIRKASASFGSTTLAISTVLAVFFGGLALGSYVFGKVSQKTTRPLKTYAWLEIILGVMVIINPMGFVLAERLFGLTYPFLENHFILLSVNRVLIVSLLMLPPSMLMGGTLPLFCKQYVKEKSKITLSVGLLYGINTMGAALGCFACGFFLIPQIGVDMSIWLGGLVNITIGLSTMLLQRNIPANSIANPAADILKKKKPDKVKKTNSSPSSFYHVFLVGILFLFSGFVALGNEIIWTRFFALIVHNTVYTYTITLTITLIGIVIGSLIVSFFADRFRLRAILFGSIHLLAGLSILIILLQPAQTWKPIIDSQEISHQLIMFLVVLLFPALLSGMSYPLGIRLVLDSPRLAGIQVGRMTAVNTVGGILGSLILGFFLMPGLGLHLSLLISTGISMAIGITAWLLLDKESQFKIKAPILAACILAWFFIPMIYDTQLPRDFLTSEEQLVEFREGLRSNLSIVKVNNNTLLKIDRLWQGQDEKSHQIMAAHIPMLLHPDAKKIVVVGLGVGQTASRFLLYPIQQLDCIEIERELLRLLEKHFDSDWMNDPRVRFIIEDGRNYVSYTETSYDIISIEVGQVFRPGLSSFYTQDFYQKIKDRLNPNGLVAQFVPIGFLDPIQFRGVIASFISVFPKSVLYYNTYELLLMGSLDKEPILSKPRLQKLLDRPAINQDLQYSYWGGPKVWLNQPEAILAGFLCKGDSLIELAKNAPIYTDTLPTLEYETARNQQVRSPINIIQLIREHLDPLEEGIQDQVDDSFLEKARGIRKHNLGEIMATFLFQQFAATGDLTLLAQALLENDWDPELKKHMGLVLARQGRFDEAIVYFEQVLEIDPDNIDANINLGVIQLEKRQIDLAVRYLTRSVTLQPNSMLAHLNLARALVSKEDPEAAKKHFQKALELSKTLGQSEWSLRIKMEINKL